VVNVSLREISGSVGATTTEIAWVVTAYAISNVIIIPLTGMLSDLFGRKNYFTGSVIIFTFSSLMCGMSGSLWTLVFWRFVQGIGGGGLLSTSQSIIVGAYPPEKISTANAIFGMGIIMGPTFGPTIGGYITEHFSWHWIFLINIPIGVIATVLAWTYVPDREGATKPKKIDWWGIVFLIAGVGSLQYVLEEGPIKDWFDSWEVIIFFSIATAGFIAFIVREISISYPAVNIKLYANYNLAMGSIMNFMLGFLLFGTVFIFPLFVQISLGWTPTQTGTFMIPGALCSAIGMPFVGRMLGKGANPKIIILIGITLTFSFLMLLSFASPDSSESDFYFPFVLRGFGMAFMMTPILSLAVGGLRGKDMAQGIAMSNMLRQLGGAVGIALINVFLTHQNAQIRGAMVSFIDQYGTARDRIIALTQMFISKGYAFDDAQALAYKAIDMALTRQQMLVSYTQGFFIVGLFLLAAIPVVLLVRYKKTKKGPVVIADH
jgi:DHA2 family multidrug resistance protein